MARRLHPLSRRKSPRHVVVTVKYPTRDLRVGESYRWPIEDIQGTYNWPEHNRLRSAVYRFMRFGGKGRRFTVRQRVVDEILVAVVTRVR